MARGGMARVPRGVANLQAKEAMSTALIPHTGEVIDLRAATPEQLADTLASIRDLESRLREAKQQLTDALYTHLDRDRHWSLVAGPYKVSGKSDAMIAVWDTVALLEVLDGMVATGEITPAAVERAVETRVTYTVRAAGIGALLKNPELAARIEPCRTLVDPTDRRITVTRT